MRTQTENLIHLFPLETSKFIWISPSKELIFTHVEQLSKVINRNKTGISYIHAGFLGAWGEWHRDQYGTKKIPNKFRQQLIDKLLTDPNSQNYKIYNGRV